MAIIRAGTEEDLDQLVELSRRFLNASPYSAFTTVNESRVRNMLLGVLEFGGLFVAVEDERIVGAIAGQILTQWYDSTPVAAELGWWVEPELRGRPSAIGLLRAFERWGAERGAVGVVLSDLLVAGEAPAGELFERLGYEVVERSHFKKL